MQIVVDAGLDLNKYSAVLNSCSKRLESADDLREIHKLVHTIQDDTRLMSDSNRAIAGTLKDRAAVEMKRYFKTDFKRIGHAKNKISHSLVGIKVKKD